MTLDDSSSAAFAILASIRADGYHVSEESRANRREGTEQYLCTAEYKTSRETWTVRAADRG